MPTSRPSTGPCEPAPHVVLDRVYPERRATLSPTGLRQVYLCRSSPTPILSTIRATFFRDEMKKRAPATEAAGSGWNISTETYLAEVWALHKDIPDQIRANQDAPLDMERDATIFLTHKALLRKEKIFSANFMSTGVWTAPGSDATRAQVGPRRTRPRSPSSHRDHRGAGVDRLSAEPADARPAALECHHRQPRFYLPRQRRPDPGWSRGGRGQYAGGDP